MSKVRTKGIRGKGFAGRQGVGVRGGASTWARFWSERSRLCVRSCFPRGVTLCDFGQDGLVG